MSRDNNFFWEANSRPNVRLGVILGAVALLLFGGSSVLSVCWKPGNAWPSIVVSIINSFATLFGISAIWELIVKVKFAQKILELAKISVNLKDSGIIQYTNNFEEDISWKEELSHTKKLVAVFTYAATWRHHNIETIKNFLAQGGEIEVFLPDNSKNDNMSFLDKRFKYKKGQTKDKIQEAIDFFNNLKKELAPQGIIIQLYPQTFRNSYYLMDDDAIMATFNHSEDRGCISVFKGAKGGKLYEFIKREINAIRDLIKKEGGAQDER